MIDNGHLRICCPSFKCCILSTTIDREEIFSLISVEHQQKYRVLLNNKVSNEDRLQLQNGSKARCPFCDHIFDVNIESPSADSQVVTIEAPSSPTTSTTDSEKKLALQCPNVSLCPCRLGSYLSWYFARPFSVSKHSVVRAKSNCPRRTRPTIVLSLARK